MADTTHALSSRELEACRAALGRIETRKDELYLAAHARSYFEFLLLSGCHPSVLADPAKSDLQVTREPTRYIVSWIRPKKKGVAGLCRIPLTIGSSTRWVPTFVAVNRQDPPSARSLQRLIKAIAEEAHLVGTATPRTLRHTAVVLALKRGMSIDDAKATYGVSDRVLVGYSRQYDEDRLDRVQAILTAGGEVE